MAADHAPVRQGRTNVCVCGELVADHATPPQTEPNSIGDAVAASAWVLDHPAETVALLVEAGVLEPFGLIWRPKPGSHRWQHRKHRDGRAYPAVAEFVDVYRVSIPTKGDETGG